MNKGKAMSPKPASKEPMKKITLTLPEDLHRYIKAAAAKYGVSISAFVRCILVLFILREFEACPALLEKGTTVASWREKWQHEIIPEVEAELMPPKAKTKKQAEGKPAAKTKKQAEGKPAAKKKRPDATAAKKPKKPSS